jgi:copper chaperone
MLDLPMAGRIKVQVSTLFKEYAMYQLQVENMSCGHCVGAVTKAVHAIDAGAKVEIDLATKSVKIDSATPLAPLKSAIADAGYPVTSAA